FETLGYFGTLDRLKETDHSNRLWWGGQPGKNHSDKKYKGPTISDLGVLFRSDREAYLKRIHNALDPDLANAGSRLNERALVRVLIDITSSFRTPRGWVSSLTNGVWLEICQNRRIRDLHVDILHEIKTVE
ncbi:hypothetical protein JG687_00009993, partial [Phytophthora cactorum]